MADNRFNEISSHNRKQAELRPYDHLPGLTEKPYSRPFGLPSASWLPVRA